MFDTHKGWRHVAWTRIHCTLGDVLILLGAFWFTAAVFRSWRWPTVHGNGPVVVFLAAGLSYTAWSEWFNTTVREAWTYAPAMPRVPGMGLSPLIQWFVLPAYIALILRLSKRHVLSTGEIQ